MFARILNVLAEALKVQAAVLNVLAEALEVLAEALEAHFAKKFEFSRTSNIKFSRTYRYNILIS